MGFLFDRGNKVSRNAVFSLTEQGRTKAQEFKGDPTSQILVALETSGSLNTDEIAKETGLTRGNIERHLTYMQKNGFVVTGGGMEI
jgi:predicted ArsR family transcriptional regulator